MPMIPLPTRIESGTGDPFALDASVVIAVVSPELEAVARQFAAALVEQIGLQLAIVAGLPDRRAIVLELTADDPELLALPPTGGVRADAADPDIERYGLAVTADTVRLWAIAVEGIYRGLTALRQLLFDGVNLAPIRVLDAPRFAWRGLSLDTVRTFWPPEQVREIIDLLALYKFNVLHLHGTGSEGWRFAIDTWPKLAGVGGQGAVADRPGGFYTKADFAALVRYAAERFITLVPEVDMPGHVAAIFRAYPELAGDGVTPGDTSGPNMLKYLHPAHPGVWHLVGDVFQELAAMTPAAYIHIGGDEPFGMPDDLYDQFIDRIRPLVRATGKKLVAWQEAARAGLDAADIAQYWMQFDPAQLAQLATMVPPEGITLPDGTQLTPDMLTAIGANITKSEGDLDRALAGGSSVIVSLTSRSYLDTQYAEPSADPAQEADRQRLGMPFYPKFTVSESHDWDPATIDERLREEHVAGVEAAIWCEGIATFDELLFMLLPRLPGIAERGWTAAGASTWEGYGPRLAAQAPYWQHRGWNWFRSSVVDWFLE